MPAPWLQHTCTKFQDIEHAGIDQQSGNQELLKGLCKMAHTFGITVIAEGVQTEAEPALLPQLGFDAATGPTVSK